MTQPLTQAIILGSARGIRRLDPTQSIPSSLKVVDSGGTVLDWALHALTVNGITQVIYVGGYQIQKVIEKHPDLDCRFYAEWQRGGELTGLLSATRPPTENCLIMRASTVILPQALERLSNSIGDIVAGYHHSSRIAEFSGVIAIRDQLTIRAFDVARELVGENPTASIDQWLKALVADGLEINRVNLDGLAAPTSDPVALAGTVFSSKAKTLANIRPLMTTAIVLDQVSFSVAEWFSEPNVIMAKVTESFGDGQVVVRSSAKSEDGVGQSMAGHYRSVLNVSARNRNSLQEAVEAVIDSYKRSHNSSVRSEVVFIQPQMTNLAASGVILTRDCETGAPYIVLNVDRTSGRSDTVTSGSQTAFDTVYVSHEAEHARLPNDVKICVGIANELENLTNLDGLDIEFGIDRSSQAYLFQVRPLTGQTQKYELADEDLNEELGCVREFLDAHMRPHPLILGDTTLFSSMADWNPAEMIGAAPKPLALSLYQRLVGEHSWAEARAEIGYRDVLSEPLIISLAGRPYVDVRASLNSFLPTGLNDTIGNKWITYGLSLLKNNPHLHDKIEFDVALTCLTFDTNEENSRLSEAGLTLQEIEDFRQQMLVLTDGVLNRISAPIKEQLKIISKLESKRAKLLAAGNTDIMSLARQARYLLQDCNRYGVVPFSVLARYAFIAMALLRSLKKVGVFSNDEYELILRSIPTIATEMSQDLAYHATGKMETRTFLERYGHLRPSSYDITSPNYLTEAEFYLNRHNTASNCTPPADPIPAKKIFDRHSSTIGRLLKDIGFTANADDLRDFVLDAIPARERGKFEFMKNLDAVLETTAKIGVELGFDRQDISFLPIDWIESGATASPTSAAQMRMRREIEFAKKRWNLTCAVRLPHLVRSSNDVDAFQLEKWVPNFVSTQRVVAPPLFLDGKTCEQSLDGRIVMIRAADPGYDWIFGYSMKGLITQFGGVGSHMAIRAAEFGIPAAIGCGEIIFETLQSASLIELDCINKRVNVVHS